MDTPNPDSNPRLVLDSAPALIHTGLPDGYLDFFNQTWLTYVGRSLEDLQGWKWTASIHPDDLDAMLQAWRTALASGEPFLHEARVRRADGEFRWMVHHKIALRDERGSIVKWYGTSIDIEDRKRSEETLRESEERYRGLSGDLRRSETFLMEAQRLSHTGSWREHLKSGAMYWSPEYCRIMGFDPALSAPPVEWAWQRVHPEDLKRIRRIIGTGMREKTDVEYENRIIRPDGAVRSIVSVLHPIVDASGEVVEVMGTCADITERRVAEAEIRKQAELLSLTHDALIVRDHDGCIRFWNRGAEELYGWTAKEALGQRTHELLRTVFPAPLEEIETMTREQGRWEGELVQVRRDGAQIVVSSRWSQQRDERGRPVAILVTNTDITARKRADEELRKSEERYRALIEVSPQMVWTTPADGWTIFANQWWYEYTGLTNPETQGFEPIHPEHRRRMWKSWRQTVAAGRDWIEEAPLRRAADGQYRWHLLRGRPMRDADGRIIRWIGIAIDIHDRREAEEALRESEEHYRALINLSPQMVWVTQADGSNIYLNSWFYDYTGLTQAEGEGFGWAQAIHPEDRDRTIELWRQHVASESEWTTETQVRRAADGQYRWHLVRGLPIRDTEGQIVRWIGIAVDIHDRREAEESLRRTEAWLSEAQRLSHTGSFAQNLDTGALAYVSPELLRIYGFDPAAGTPSTEEVIRRFHPEDRLRVAETFERAAREKTGHSAEWRLVLPDGTLRHIQSRVDPIFDAAGRPVELIGTTIDVTERKRAEEALQESEKRYRNIFETVGVAILEEDFSKVMARLGDLKSRGVHDFRRYLAEHPEFARETLSLVRVTDANDAAVALFGAASKQEFLDALTPLTTREVEAAWVAQLLAVGEGRRSVEEVVLTSLGGEKVHTLVTIEPPPESSGYDSVLVTVVDLSERKRAEEALTQAQAALTHVTRVATVGEVSASIAHELNQPLGAMANNANACLGLLSGAQPDLDEVRNALADIVGDAERASTTIERVRGLAKRSAPERIPVRLSDLVHEVARLAAAESASRGVAIRTDVPKDLPLVLGDRVELQQVLLNLVVNAMDAMSGASESDRTLEIRGQADELDRHPAARISVQDRGIGLHAEQIDQLFEPFYTTKSHGMGLGLAISRSIIEAHGGRLWAEANPGLGATFSFALPAAAAGH